MACVEEGAHKARTEWPLEAGQSLQKGMQVCQTSVSDQEDQWWTSNLQSAEIINLCCLFKLHMVIYYSNLGKAIQPPGKLTNRKRTQLWKEIWQKN
jgi:hypothetical protein